MTEVHEGLEGVVAFETQIAEPDKEGSSLRYRGVDIEQIVGRVPFENVWGLLIDGSYAPGLPAAEPYNLPVHTGDVRVDVQAAVAMLAPAFGNVHGEYGPRGIRLEYDRLEAINKAVGDRVRLVLHGADPFDEDIFQRCIRAGVSKININKGMNKHYAAVQEQMAGKPLTSVIEAGTEAMQKAIEKYMHELGSAGKAVPL